MVPSSFEKLKKYVETPIEVSIEGLDGEEKGPSVQKKLSKVAMCPDETHVRIYFDPFYFIAIPVSSNVHWSGNEFRAFDSERGLFYCIKRGA
ncbi:hypothetical protein GCM10008967_14160 [Bacillus carboniphilus]|uniref:Uncharacterized protein n=1 Tax=Bacillus carboniphilus TaxID=86663 RepID=A0ABN0W4F2_9BACI